MSTAATGRTFTFIRLIDSGGFGSVYLAKMAQSDGVSRVCAVKLLHPKWSEDAEAASRMRDEARLLGWLRHRNIVEVFDLTRIDGRIALVMEYLDAMDAKGLVAAARTAGKPIPMRAALELCAFVAAALDAAYNRPPYAGERPLRVIHRDIKPSNIMVDTSGGVKVLDFGVARAEFEERESHTQEVTYGSLEYMPPERLFYEPDSDRSDVYSVGVTLYELLALQRFGKARLRAEQHLEMVHERLSVLWSERGEDVPFEVQAEVDELLRSMIAYDEAARPVAAHVATTLRGLARRCTDLGLEEWAERTVPPLLRVQHDEQEGRADALCDNTFPEESRGFPSPASSELSQPMPAPAARTPDAPDADIERSDAIASARWVAQRDALAALAEIAPAAEVAPPALVAPEPSAPSSRRWWAAALVVGSGLVALAAVLLLIVAVVGAPYLAAMLDTPAGAVAAAPTAPAEAPPPPPPAAPDGPSATFLSAWQGTQKLTVRCDSGAGEGATEAWVAGEAPGTCTVTAVDGARHRVTAVVKDVEPRSYRCFVDGAKTCE